MLPSSVRLRLACFFMEKKWKKIWKVAPFCIFWDYLEGEFEDHLKVTQNTQIHVYLYSFDVVRCL